MLILKNWKLFVEDQSVYNPKEATTKLVKAELLFNNTHPNQMMFLLQKIR